MMDTLIERAARKLADDSFVNEVTDSHRRIAKLVLDEALPLAVADLLAWGEPETRYGELTVIRAWARTRGILPPMDAP